VKRDPKYDVLFEPIRLGPKVMKNRFYQTPHCTNLGVDYPGSQAYFRAMKAEGGWGAVNTEYCSIHPESDDSPHVAARLWDDGDIQNLSLLCEMAHDHGALSGVELWYGSAHSHNFETRLASRGPSQIASDETLVQSCIAMSKSEIRELQQFYVEAAKRARSAGFDIVNVYGAHSHSITHQFLDPFYNKRTDEYGGSFENRARFWKEVIERVREAVGDECAIAVRFGIDTLRDGAGIRAEEDGHRFIEYVDDLVDVWDLAVGNMLAAGEDSGPSRTHRENFQKPWVDGVRPYTTKPIVCVGRFVSPDVMVEVIRSGQADIIGAARPSIADPFLPKKIEDGRLDEIRECIGCNVCLSRVWGGASRIICTQNPTVGEEYRRGWHPERFRKVTTRNFDALIVGAGPAGMECAMVLGRRGVRRVHLIDSEDSLGGSLRWISTLPGLGEWARVINYRAIQLQKLRDSVEFIPRTHLTSDDVLNYGADIVVTATGAHWAINGLSGVNRDGIAGTDATKEWCLTPEQIMVEGKEPKGERIVLYDCDGYFVGVSVAEKLARNGKQVTIVTPFAQIAPYMWATNEAPRMYRTLRELGVTFVTSHIVTEVTPSTVRGHDAILSEGSAEWDADAVVLVTQRLSNDDLFRSLTVDDDALDDAEIRGVFRIGDSVVPGLIADAVFDGHRLAREIDSPTPAAALPFIRERQLRAHLVTATRDFDEAGVATDLQTIGTSEPDGNGRIESDLRTSTTPPNARNALSTTRTQKGPEGPTA
jgi:dimethylamine/trimethylamine dehydrogenase